MNALQLRAPGVVELVTMPVPMHGPEVLLVRTGATTICTSDLTDIRSNPYGIRLPVVIGHEAAGTVVQVGEAASGFRVGDRIAAHPVHPCRECVECRRGLGHLCPHLRHFGIDLHGTFAEYFLVRQDRARQIPDDLDFTSAALAEPVCVALEAVRRANIAAGTSLLIVGDGVFGLLMARIALRQVGVRVAIAGRHQFRLAFARGATCIDVSEHPLTVESALALSGGDGFDAIIIAVADPTAASLAVHMLRGRGRLVIFAPMHGDTPIDLTRVLIKEIEIVGAVNDQDLFDESIELLTDPNFHAADLITHRFALADFESALARAAHRHDESIKTAFVFDTNAIPY